MSEERIIVELKSVSKDYKIYPSNRDMLLERLTGRKRHTLFQSLSGIDLEIRRGDVVGILGANGAGKSTLLKLIAGTILPSTGTISVGGKVSAILELGTGFSDHSSGRENITMGCLCLGMTPDQIKMKSQDIIAFSELDEFIDRPFGTYSSGMQARLTLAVALSVEPEILIVDEALSVGDARFAQKSFAHFQRMKEQGCTILLVSHDTNTISTFCETAIILDRGKIVGKGSAEQCVRDYHRLLFGHASMEGNSATAQPTQSSTEAAVDLPIPATATRYGSRQVELKCFSMRDSAGQTVQQLQQGQSFHLAMTFEATEDVEDWSGGFVIRDRRASVMFGLTNKSAGIGPDILKCGERREIALDLRNNLAPGYYSVTLGVADPHNGHKWDFVERAIEFEVVGPAGLITSSVVQLDHRLEIRVP